MRNRTWSEDELSFIQDKWGTVSIPGIAESLGRTVDAVKVKAVKMGLGRHLHSGSEITLNALFNALGKGKSYSWLSNRWVRCGLPIKYKKSLNRKYRVIDIDKFWKWAEKNKDIIDFSKFEKGMLGAEPEWVSVKRAADIKAAKFKKTPWTKEEDEQLKALLSTFRYGYKEISEILRRTDGAIIKRVNDLGLKQRPLRADNHIKWTEEEVKVLLEMRKLGYSPEVIASKLPLRSIKAVLGKLERISMNG